MGDSISEGTVHELLKKPGDYVQADEIIATVETDKVQVDIRSPRAGVIEKYFAAAGETVQVNADFYVIDTEGKPGSGSAAASPPPKAAETPKTAAQEAPKQAPKQEAPK